MLIFLVFILSLFYPETINNSELEWVRQSVSKVDFFSLFEWFDISRGLTLHPEQNMDNNDEPCGFDFVVK